MKIILLSVRPRYTKLIFSGEKSLEVRMTIPKDLPARVLIYETLGTYNEISKKYDGSGKIVGEFILKDFKKFEHIENKYHISAGELESTCLTYEELEDYGKGKLLYGWITSNELCKFRVPKELSEFGLKRPPQSWMYLTKSSFKKSSII